MTTELGDVVARLLVTEALREAGPEARRQLEGMEASMRAELGNDSPEFRGLRGTLDDIASDVADELRKVSEMFRAKMQVPEAYLRNWNPFEGVEPPERTTPAQVPATATAGGSQAGSGGSGAKATAAAGDSAGPRPGDEDPFQAWHRQFMADLAATRLRIDELGKPTERPQADQSWWSSIRDFMRTGGRKTAAEATGDEVGAPKRPAGSWFEQLQNLLRVNDLQNPITQQMAQASGQLAPLVGRISPQAGQVMASFGAAGNAARAAGGATAGATSGAAGAGAGGASAGAGALGAVAGGALLGMAATSMAIEVVRLPERIKEWGRTLAESQRHLSSYNGTIAVAFAKFDLANVQRQFTSGMRTAASTEFMLEKQSGLMDTVQPVIDDLTSIKNDAAGIVAIMLKWTPFVINMSAGLENMAWFFGQLRGGADAVDDVLGDANARAREALGMRPNVAPPQDARGPLGPVIDRWNQRPGQWLPPKPPLPPLK